MVVKFACLFNLLAVIGMYISTAYDMFLFINTILKFFMQN